MRTDGVQRVRKSEEGQEVSGIQGSSRNANRAAACLLIPGNRRFLDLTLKQADLCQVEGGSSSPALTHLPFVKQVPTKLKA